MSERITDVKIGDVVTCYDEYSRDGETHLMTVESIEKDKEYACEDNPEGIVLYGQDLEHGEDDDNCVSVVHSGNFIGICDDKIKYQVWDRQLDETVETFDSFEEADKYINEIEETNIEDGCFSPERYFIERSYNMDNIMYNSVGKRVAIVDDDFRKVDSDKFRTLDFTDSEIMRFDYEDSWNLKTILSYEKSKELVDCVYKEYLSKLANWLDAKDLTTDVSLRNDGTLTVSVSAEKFISSENINTAYVESHDLKGEKGNIVRDKLIAAAKEKGYDVSNIRPKKVKTDIERD